MSQQLTLEQYEALEKLSPEDRAAAMASFKAAVAEAGEDAPAEVRKELMAQAMQIANDNSQGAEIRQRSELELVAPGLMLGSFECRPISMGVLQILERIKHPLFTGNEENMTLGESAQVMYCLCETDLAKLVQGSLDGTFVADANVWAFELDPVDLIEMNGQLQPMLDAAEGLQQEAPKKPKKRRARNR